MRRIWLLLMVAVLCGVWQPSGLAQADKTLDVYFIDVEGGQSTLFVTPAGESILVDSGLPGGRDSGRIVATIKQVGLDHLDYMVVTHLDGDHVGGVSEIAQQIPIRNFVDHGPRQPVEGQPAGGSDYNAKLDVAYGAARAKGNYTIGKPGDKLPVKGLDWQFVTSQGERITSPLPGAGAPNPECAQHVAQAVNNTEDKRSLGSVIALGRFRMIDLGDLPYNNEHDLVCPSNLLGTVDVYLTTAHGLALSNPAASVHALHPRVTIMNNGPTKGDSKETWVTLKSSPGLEDIWQLHYSVDRPANKGFREASQNGGPEQNAPEQFIANMAPEAAHNPFYAIKLSARPDGSFSVTNLRNGFKKDYPAGAMRSGALPPPVFHHVHLNSTNPERALAWYSKLWPAGDRTTVAGFPAFHGSDVYLLYTKVSKQAPGAFDRKLHRSVPQTPFWTFGSGITDTAAFVDRLTKLDAKDFKFLPVYSGPDDKKGVIRSSLAPQGDQLLTVSQLAERAAREKNAPPQTRPGNQDFGYLVDPDGMLYEFNSAPKDNFWEHMHFWHEQPLCAANWYVEHLGMTLAPARDPKTGQMIQREKWDPCDVPIGEKGYPTFMPFGQLRNPIFSVRLANGCWADYTRQCRDGRCGPGNDQPLSPSAGTVVDHIGLAYPNLDDVITHLKATGVAIEKGPYKFGDTRAVMIHDLDGLSLELIEMAR